MLCQFDCESVRGTLVFERGFTGLVWVCGFHPEGNTTTAAPLCTVEIDHTCKFFFHASGVMLLGANALDSTTTHVVYNSRSRAFLGI